MKKEIKHQVIRGALTLMLGSLGYMLTGLGKSLLLLIPEERITPILSDPKTWVISLLVLISAILFACVVYLLNERDLINIDGIWRDKKGNPYCPSCKKPMSAFGIPNKILHYECPDKKQCGVKLDIPKPIKKF